MSPLTSKRFYHGRWLVVHRQGRGAAHALSRRSPATQDITRLLEDWTSLRGGHHSDAALMEPREDARPRSQVLPDALKAQPRPVLLGAVHPLRCREDALSVSTLFAHGPLTHGSPPRTAGTRWAGW